MTTSVDVLAVWTEMADSIANRRDECLGRGQFIQAEIFREMLAKHSRSMIAVNELIEAADRANGDHSAPHDCYATGPLTGDPIRDLVACPGCELSSALARVKGA